MYIFLQEDNLLRNLCFLCESTSKHRDLAYALGQRPGNMLGYVASNLIEGMLKTIQYDEIDAVVAKGGLLIDVREPEEVAKGDIPGSVNIPLGALRQRLEDLPKDQPIYITCQVGLRGYLAARILAAEGCTAINLDGGYKTYSSVYGRNR